MKTSQDPTIQAGLATLESLSLHRVTGQVRAATAAQLEAKLPSVGLGEVARVHTADGWRLAQVTALRDATVLLSPLEAIDGVRVGARVERIARGLTVRVSEALIGRVLDGLGRPIDDGPPIGDASPWPIHRPAPPALSRRRIDAKLETGVRAIDALMTLGQGQRVGIFAPAGVGKTTLLGQLGRQTRADVVVVALIGERGREVRAFLEDALGEGRTRAIVVVATADAPAQTRVNAALVATSIAEFFRDILGRDTLLLVDSLSRLARAQREVGARAGEWPVRQGYPASLFELLARLLERAGNSARGSMTALYTLLTQAGDAGNEDAIADEVSGLLDGHLVLSPELAARAHWPALDVLASLSRLQSSVASPEHLEDAEQLRRMLASHAASRDLRALGAYQRGRDPLLDETLERWHEVEAFLQQRADRSSALDDTLEQLADLVG